MNQHLNKLAKERATRNRPENPALIQEETELRIVLPRETASAKRKLKEGRIQQRVFLDVSGQEMPPERKSSKKQERIDRLIERTENAQNQDSRPIEIITIGQEEEKVDLNKK